MITRPQAGHRRLVALVDESHEPYEPRRRAAAGPRAPQAREARSSPPSVDPAETPEARLRRLVDAHFGLVWRTLRFHGVPQANADDGAQQAFCVLARRLAEVQPGAEAAFLFTTACRVASDIRRSAKRKPLGSEEGELERVEAPLPSPEELVDQAKARAVLEEILAEMPLEVRTVFTLIEIEELPLAEVARLTSAPIGTVSSRLRRGRKIFEASLKRRRAADAGPKGGLT